MLGCAKTGTGKTAAFAMPILDYLGHERPALQPNRPTALVLAPTRELAIQIADSFHKYGKHVQFRQALVYGGVRQEAQVQSLRRGVDLLIATPGRLLDLMTQGHVDLRGVEIFVLDEADRMLDMGFQPALKKIVADLPQDRQSLFFSATLPPRIRSLAAQFLFNPVIVTAESDSPNVENISQSVRFVERGEKLTLLKSLLAGEDVKRTIVFARTKRGANGLAQKLERAGLRAAAIHGNKSQSARQRALQAFREKHIQVLVATDVASRGIDVDRVTHVVNYDVPLEPESYIHRIGRTGRAGAQGIAVTFCTRDEMQELHEIEKVVGGCLTMHNPEARFAANSQPGAKPQRSRTGGSKRGRKKAAQSLPQARSRGYKNKPASKSGPKAKRPNRSTKHMAMK